MAQKKKQQLPRKAAHEPRQRKGHKPDEPSKRQSLLWKHILGLASDPQRLRQLQPFARFKETPEQEEQRRKEQEATCP